MLGLIGGGRASNPARVVLTGVLVSQFFAAVTSVILTISGDANSTRGFAYWLLGSLGGARWQPVVMAGLVILVGTVAIQFFAPALDAFTFGWDAAGALGINVTASRYRLMLQRAQLARALAQQPTEILLDEPTNHLDVRHQLELLELLRSLHVTCVLALHDLALAARYCDHIVFLDRGRVVATGPPERVVAPDLIGKVDGVEALVNHEPSTGIVTVTYVAPISSQEGSSAPGASAGACS